MKELLTELQRRDASKKLSSVVNDIFRDEGKDHSIGYVTIVVDPKDNISSYTSNLTNVTAIQDLLVLALQTTIRQIKESQH